jgi:hypothetical protein
MLRLAECLIDGGENIRAAELLQAAIRRMVDEGAGLEQSRAGDERNHVANPERSEMVREMLSEARFVLGQLLLRDQDDVSSALTHLSAVETRSSVGVAARLLEAEIHHRRGQFSTRDRVLGRLLEAAEMRWIDLSESVNELISCLKIWRSSMEPSLLEYAERLVATVREPIARWSADEEPGEE